MILVVYPIILLFTKMNYLDFFKDANRCYFSTSSSAATLPVDGRCEPLGVSEEVIHLYCHCATIIGWNELVSAVAAVFYCTGFWNSLI